MNKQIKRYDLIIDIENIYKEFMQKKDYVSAINTILENPDLLRVMQIADIKSIYQSYKKAINDNTKLIKLEKIVIEFIAGRDKN